jgi:hypothetical protein
MFQQIWVNLPSEEICQHWQLYAAHSIDLYRHMDMVKIMCAFLQFFIVNAPEIGLHADKFVTVIK